MKTSLAITTVTVALGLGACASEDVTRHDTRGHYATSSQFESDSRDEFTAAIRDGLADYERRLADLRGMSHALNDDARDEFYDDVDELEERESLVRARLSRLEAALPDEWREHREGVRDAYEELREELDDAYEDVTEEI